MLVETQYFFFLGLIVDVNNVIIFFINFLNFFLHAMRVWMGFTDLRIMAIFNTD